MCRNACIQILNLIHNLRRVGDVTNFGLTSEQPGGRIWNSDSGAKIRARFRGAVFCLQRNSDRKLTIWRFALAGIAVLAVFCSACTSLNPEPTAQQKAEKIDPMLAAAGFRELYADTPAKAQSLDALPPLTVKYYTNKKGQRQYWFADPYNCKCLYLGDDGAYGRYENLKLQQQIAHEQEQAAQENLEAAQDMEMDGMGPWGFTPGVGFGIW